MTQDDFRNAFDTLLARTISSRDPKRAFTDGWVRIGQDMQAEMVRRALDKAADALIRMLDSRPRG